MTITSKPNGTSETPLKLAQMKSSTSRTRQFFRLFHFMIHAALFMLCLALAATYTLKIIHDEYFVTLIERARRTDWDLMDEYTYYERHCNVVDISATTKEERSQLVVDSKGTAISTMMTHGAILIPQLMSDSIMKELREFLVWKNNAVKGTNDEIPLSTPRNRISYGIEAAEHPAVVRALKTIHSNEKLKDILEGLVGRNPALTEITAITAKPGARHQNWHPDVEPDGNGIQFGRTYSHSYSLFIPLQNTTGKMGVTQLCLGSHYCVDSVDAQCQKNAIGVHEFGDGGIWQAGDAVLFNQQIWHRGTKHRDFKAQDRVVFILSFIGRPIDNRQLSRGTYIHMKWNMWGHTWQDLADAATSMINPWNILRSLHLWKAKGREWGYDLFTAAAFRVANGPEVFDSTALEGLISFLEKKVFPGRFDGSTGVKRHEALQIHLSTTIDKILAVLIKANKFAVALSVSIVLGASLMERHESKSPTRFFSRRILLLGRTYGIAIILGSLVLYNIQSSPWAKNIVSGRTLMRPFPNVDDVMRDDPSVSKGPTTVPLRTDVLVGTRLASKTIGVYSRWVDYHPGNRKFLRDVAAFGGNYFRSLERSFPILADAIVQGAIRDIHFDNGRFLHQDYRTGDWRLMSGEESLEYVRTRFYLGTNTIEARIKDEIDYKIGDYRFGFARLTGMSKISQTCLQAFEKQFILPRQGLDEFTLSHRLTSFSSPPNKGSSQLKTFARCSFTKPSCKRVLVSDRTPTSFFEDSKREMPELRPFVEVHWHYKNSREEVRKQIPATILAIFDDGFAEIALYGIWPHEFSEKLVMHVPLTELTPRIEPVEGLRVSGNFLGRGEWYPGKIDRVRPSGRVDILYDDSDFEADVDLDRFILV